MNEPTDPVRLVVACHDGRGHTGKLAAAVRQGAKDVAGVGVAAIAVDEITSEQWFQLDEAHAVIFGAPTYMGSASAAFHQFAEASSRRWLTRRWQDKLAAGFTVSASWGGDKQNTIYQLLTLAQQLGMVWVGLGLAPGNNHSKGSSDDLNRTGASVGVMAQANADQGNEGIGASEFRTAQALGKRVAEAALRWHEKAPLAQAA